jgi:hypothetical protein
MSDERRRDERIDVLGGATGEVTGVETVNVLEISEGGAQVEVRTPLQIESLHDLRLNLGGRSVVAKARVAHCHVSDMDQEHVVYRAGFEFVDLPLYAQEAIAAHLQLLKSSRE